MTQHDVERLNHFGRDRLPGMLGLEITRCDPECVTGRIPVTPPLIAGTGFLWAPVVIALADTLCAYGAGSNLPAEARSFTTVELKTNFLGTVGVGATIAGRATPAHLGRTTQVWDAEVSDEDSGRRLALFRCTQVLLYPKA